MAMNKTIQLGYVPLRKDVIDSWLLVLHIIRVLIFHVALQVYELAVATWAYPVCNSFLGFGQHSLCSR